MHLHDGANLNLVNKVLKNLLKFRKKEDKEKK
jgi:hypothetical protein